MEKRRLVAWLVFVAVVVAGIGGWMVAFQQSPKLGLDLRGGISVTMTPVIEEGTDLDSDVLDETIEVIRTRVDSLGVSEPEISRQGNDVLIQLPGVEDRNRALSIIGRTAKLTFRPVTRIIRPEDPEYRERGPNCGRRLQPNKPVPDDATPVLCGTEEMKDNVTPPIGPDQPPPKFELGPAELTGRAIRDALAEPEQTSQGGVSNNWVVSLRLTRNGSNRFETVTGDLACQRDQGTPGEGRLAVVLDDVVENAPTMSPDIACDVGIAGGEATITVGGDRESAQDLALVLRTGSLPITLEPSTVVTVSPTLGADSLRAGLIAGAIGLALVAIYLIVFYRWLGLVGVAALLVFGAVTLGLITAMGLAFGFTLTLAGIAGVIVSIGIAADSSILYFERIRDEVAAGKTVRSSVVRAWKPSLRTNLTANTVTFLAAIVLYFLAVGSVRGFAFTLGIATITDLLILFVFTKSAVILLGQGGRLSARSLRAAPDVPTPEVAR